MLRKLDEMDRNKLHGGRTAKGPFAQCSQRNFPSREWSSECSRSILRSSYVAQIVSSLSTAYGEEVSH